MYSQRCLIVSVTVTISCLMFMPENRNKTPSFSIDLSKSSGLDIFTLNTQTQLAKRSGIVIENSCYVITKNFKLSNQTVVDVIELNVIQYH